MAHITVRHYQSKSGLKWTATQATWSSELQKIKEVKIDERALEALGFSTFMTPAEAKAHAKKLNAMNVISRKEQSSKVKASEKLTDLITIENSIIPTELSSAFVLHLQETWYGGQYNLRKMIQHWNLVQKILTKLKLQPHEYSKSQIKFYKYFEREGYSKSYVEKLIKVINAWGEFYSEQSKTYFKRLANPQGLHLEAIVDASDADGEGAYPISADELTALKFKLPAGQWEYMRATLWLGLRPSEFDELLKDSKKYKVSNQNGVTVLSVYQGKLKSVPKPKRWKHIPCFHIEMQKSVDDILNKVVDKPLVKTLRKAAPDLPTIGLYSGRKGFTDLMLSEGQVLENISLWMGHTSIERTWKQYKNKNLVTFNPVSKSKVI